MITPPSSPPTSLMEVVGLVLLGLALMVIHRAIRRGFKPGHRVRRRKP